MKRLWIAALIIAVAAPSVSASSSAVPYEKAASFERAPLILAQLAHTTQLIARGDASALLRMVAIAQAVRQIEAARFAAVSRAPQEAGSAEQTRSVGATKTSQVGWETPQTSRVALKSFEASAGARH